MTSPTRPIAAAAIRQYRKQEFRHVSLGDVTHAIHFAMLSEVGGRETIAGQDLEALRAFLFVLRRFVPEQAGASPALTQLLKCVR